MDINGLLVPILLGANTLFLFITMLVIGCKKPTTLFDDDRIIAKINDLDNSLCRKLDEMKVTIQKINVENDSQYVIPSTNNNINALNVYPDLNNYGVSYNSQV